MNTTKRQTAPYCILSIDGRVDVSTCNDLENEILQLIESGESQLILNCAELSYISSSGLRVFLIAQKKLNAVSGKLKLCTLQPGIKEIFDMSGFSSIFDIFNSEEDALHS